MLATLRTLARTFMGGLVLIGIALTFVLGGDGLGDVPPLWILGAQLVVAAGTHGVLEAVGYRTPAIAPGKDRETAMTTTRTALQSGVILRLALSEAVAVASIAVALIVEEGGFVVYVVGGLLGLALMAVHGYPSARVLARTRASLERDGARSYFDEAVGVPEPGAIQEL